jgi:hypothetical protein
VKCEDVKCEAQKRMDNNSGTLPNSSLFTLHALGPWAARFSAWHQCADGLSFVYMVEGAFLKV